MEQHVLKIANNCLDTNIYSYLETSWRSKFYSKYNWCSVFQHQS